MNERIKELAEQARDYADECFERFSNVEGWNVLYTEKFAELIVRECARVADIADDSGIWVGGTILTHFGVK